jgi:isopenicillin N synthase-like dioxygenase
MESNDELPISFLYADATLGALQVLSRQSDVVCSPTDVRSTESGAGGGKWINADPIQGCVVVNIGESQLFDVLYELF